MREPEYELIAVDVDRRPGAVAMVGRLLAVAAVALLVVVGMTNESVQATIIAWREQLLSVF